MTYNVLMGTLNLTYSPPTPNNVKALGYNVSTTKQKLVKQINVLIKENHTVTANTNTKNDRAGKRETRTSSECHLVIITQII